MINKVCIVGLGYIGLPTAAMFASSGVRTIGVDVNPRVVESLNRGEIIIEEPGLGELAASAVASGFLTASCTPQEAQAFIISVGTPITDKKTADMSAVKAAAEAIAPHLKKGDLVVLESTSPPGTVRDLLCPIFKSAGFDPFEDILLAHVPERVLPGYILHELKHGSRIIGGLTPAAAEAAAALYRSFVEGDIILAGAEAAEMCKLMENTYRDVNIALANELCVICERLGLSAWEVIELANRHPRVNIHLPGPGVGGHCIAVDPWFVAEKAPADAELITLSRRRNDSMPAFVAEKAHGLLSASPGKKSIAILGITFKPDIDDMRESPIQTLYGLLTEYGYDVRVHDPHVAEAPYCELSGLMAAVSGADMLLLGVNHSEFNGLPFEEIYKAMNSKIILDTRKCWDGAALEKLGFEYYLLGDGR